MYKFKPASEVPGLKPPFYVGAPDKTFPDIILTTTFSRDLYLTLNSLALREALLADPEFMKRYLGLQVVDLHAPKSDKPKLNPKRIDREKGPKLPTKKEIREEEWK